MFRHKHTEVGERAPTVGAELSDPGASPRVSQCFQVVALLSSKRGIHTSSLSTWKQLAAVLRTLSGLPDLEQLEIPIAFVREPGVQEARAALAKLLDSRPALQLTDAALG